MPAYLDCSELGATLPLPSFYWSGETDMRCLAEVISQTLAYGGVVASKPCVATGRHMPRISNNCVACRHDPALGTGNNACPFTTLCRDFLDRHVSRFRSHPCLAPQVRNLGRLDESALAAIRERAREIRNRLTLQQRPV
jgi:deoxyribodipyrimidine photolyase-like uncharacterized protein